MKTDFRCVFTSKRVGGSVKRHDSLVKQLLIINKVTVTSFIRNDFADYQRFAFLTKQAGNNGESLGAADANHSDCAHATRGGKGANGVVIEDAI